MNMIQWEPRSSMCGVQRLCPR